MCGIAGIFASRRLVAADAMEDLGRMATAIAHRGPDDQGFWCEGEQGIAFAHRRLSIVDLSPLGHQPMSSQTSRYTITYNGEIYNYRELHDELVKHGHRFRGSSDTEVLLASFEQWGVPGTLERSVGMFAFGVWDAKDRALHLVRDRFGEKPLYYGERDGLLMFASELKAMRAYRGFVASVDRNSLAAFMRYGYIPAPHCIYANVRKVRPGCILTVRVADGKLTTSERAYWQPQRVATHTQQKAGSDANGHVDQIEQLLSQAIRRQMVADVPVGAFLSGGIDSSLVVALMQKASARAVHTFSIGFTDKQFDESPYARAMAAHLGTEHTDIEVTPQDALAVIPQLPSIYDEPFADSSQIPTFLVAQLARRSVTVSLSGDAGDELFGGYGIYAYAQSRWRELRKVPLTVRKAAATLARSMPVGISTARKHNMLSWASASFPDFYLNKASNWTDPGRLVKGSSEPETAASTVDNGWNDGGDEIAHMMYVDVRQYLPDDILVKVDRAAMAVSLETRVPLLDHHVAEASWRIPTGVHFKDGRGKWILRQMLARHVPRELFERPKKGFAVPLASWLRNELRPWASDLLDRQRLRREGYFDESLIDRRWQEHLSGADDCSTLLWVVLMFQSWLAHQESAGTSA